jgi:hypothetical protein
MDIEAARGLCERQARAKEMNGLNRASTLFV